MPVVLIVLFFWTSADVAGSTSVQYQSMEACAKARALLEADAADVTPRIRVFARCTPTG